MHRTLNDIRMEGLEALRERLGRAGMIRFLQQFESGEGDYTIQRRAWVDYTSMADLKRLSRVRRKRSPKTER